MKEVKKNKECSIFQKRSGRYAVKSKQGKWLHGPDKVSVLSKEGLIKVRAPGKKKEATEESAE